MKLRFSTVDILAAVSEMREAVVGMRVHQVYDIDNKTYLFRLSRQAEEKSVLLIESGVRIHRTEFEWPKNTAPSGFTMKLRKHLKNKRLESIRQLGADRVLDLCFGSGDVAHHVIVELYDKGNLVLTDGQYLILNILRPRTLGGQEGKLVVREHYPIDSAQQKKPLPANPQELSALLQSFSKVGDNLRKALVPHFLYGPAVTEHVLSRAGFPRNCSLGSKDFDLADEEVCRRLLAALQEAEELLTEVSQKPCKGYLVQKITRTRLPGGEEKETRALDEFHPFLYEQHRSGAYLEFESFERAVDNFFSQLESQRIDGKVAHVEREAMRKLENVKLDHDRRVVALKDSQASDARRGQLIEGNLELVEKAILVIRSAIASQIGWESITALVDEARLAGDPVARAIHSLQLDKNHFTIRLCDPFAEEDSPEAATQVVEIDLDLSAYANARKFYDHKRHALKKEQKTLESSERAFKNAEKKTKQTLKEAAVTSAIVKARKSFWFEKFLWFISSENYLVIGGRDVQQNELLVKRYLKKGDLYVHADLHGASSIVVKNPSGEVVPPKTLNEAGTMALCYSAAWEAKVVTSAWWVYHHQVSKTAPTGEYLTPGSFMIRGKKNYLPPSHLVVGFGFFFKLDEDSMERHCGERRVIHADDDADRGNENVESEEVLEEEVAIEEKDGGSDSDEEDSQQVSAFPDTVVEHHLTLQTQKSDDISHDDIRPVKTTTHPTIKHQPKKEESSVANQDKTGPKRGQRFKMRKIKEKYGEQDEEERRLRMEILASAGAKKKPEVKQKKGSQPNPQTIPKSKPPPPQKVVVKTPVEDLEENEEDEDEEGVPGREDAAAMASLTGRPVPDDTLLFAVPVCAPYAALSNYKFKVKVMPGTTKRGKAAKSALSAFMHDRNAIAREKDLLRSVKDQDLSRNLPGKVKMVIAKKH